jgi:hypothetical protein
MCGCKIHEIEGFGVVSASCRARLGDRLECLFESNKTLGFVVTILRTNLIDVCRLRSWRTNVDEFEVAKHPADSDSDSQLS